MATTGTCPVCTGSLRTLTPSELGDAPQGIVGHDPVTGTIPCRNCGNPYTGDVPSGVVPLRSDGSPCAHEYRMVYSDHQGQLSMYLYECLRCPASYRLDHAD
jgi:hypothetical protein